MALTETLMILIGAGAVIALLLILIIVLFVMISKQNKRIHAMEERIGKFMRGTQVKSLEGEIAQMFDEHDVLMKTQKENRRDIQKIYDRERFMVQKIGVVKYDAFNQMGGNLSSCIALLDENDDGFLMNTVQSAGGCYSYVKEVRNGRPDMDIGKEEEEALDKAMHGRKTEVRRPQRENAKQAKPKKQVQAVN